MVLKTFKNLHVECFKKSFFFSISRCWKTLFCTFSVLLLLISRRNSFVPKKLFKIKKRSEIQDDYYSVWLSLSSITFETDQLWRGDKHSVAEWLCSSISFLSFQFFFLFNLCFFDYKRCISINITLNQHFVLGCFDFATFGKPTQSQYLCQNRAYVTLTRTQRRKTCGYCSAGGISSMPLIAFPLTILFRLLNKW